MGSLTTGRIVNLASNDVHRFDQVLINNRSYSITEVIFSHYIVHTVLSSFMGGANPFSFSYLLHLHGNWPDFDCGHGSSHSANTVASVIG